MKVIVKSNQVRLDRTRNDNVIQKQQVALDTGGDFPLAFEVTIPQGEAPYEPGEYQLAGSCFRVNRFNSLEIDPYQVSLVKLEGLRKAS